MYKIFIDTNILISAIVFDKKELELIIRSVSEGDQLIISEHVLEEATRVFMDKFPKYIEMFETFIEVSDIEVIKRKVYINKIKKYSDIRDKYDAHVIACADASNCKFIISGDKDLLSYKHRNIKIMNATNFIKYLKTD
jgi:putative PIN family toxin of toxin-antitoxin system